MGWGHWFLHGWIWSYKICSERFVFWVVFTSSTWHTPPQKSKIFLAPQKIKEPFSKALQRNFAEQMHPAWSRWWLARWVMKCLPTSPFNFFTTKRSTMIYIATPTFVIQATCFFFAPFSRQQNRWVKISARRCYRWPSTSAGCSPQAPWRPNESATDSRGVAPLAPQKVHLWNLIKITHQHV